ncbi:MAG: hypothetical protein ACLSF1_05405 [Bacteroides thetaiotaomicron]
MNKNEIKLQKNNSNRDWSDLEWIQEFHSFLQGDIPEGISLGDEYKVKLTPEQSSTVIWYLQEHFPILLYKAKFVRIVEKIQNLWIVPLYMANLTV